MKKSLDLFAVVIPFKVFPLIRKKELRLKSANTSNIFKRFPSDVTQK